MLADSMWPRVIIVHELTCKFITGDIDRSVLQLCSTNQVASMQVTVITSSKDWERHFLFGGRRNA